MSTVVKNNSASAASPSAGNKGRQVELDLAKALAIIFMVFVHTYEAH